MPIMRNTLSEDELYMLDQLESGLRSKYGGKLPRDKKSKIDALEATLNNISTAAGRKYAISKVLNEDDDFSNPDDFPKLNVDLWSLKNQEDYTPPDVEKTIEKRNKEQAENFWNWDSDEHWTKKNVKELKRQAKDAGYADFAGYLDKVRELQTNKDRQEASEKYGYNVWGSLFAPRTVEAIQRGEDPSTGDIGLDATENALYLLNPMGRAVRAWLQGVKAGNKLYKSGNLIASVADVASNPLVMELADAATYGDKDNTERKDFSIGDVTIGTGINAGMNKFVPMLWRNKDKLISTVPKSKAQIKAEQEAKLATEEANKVLEDGGSREARKTMKDLVQDELRRQDIREAFASAEDKRIALQELKEQLSKNKVVEPRKTKFSERLLGDLDNMAARDYASNKTGDIISEDPKLSKRVIRGAARDIPFVPQIVSDFVSDYYNRKEKNEEQEKINQALKLLGRRK